MFDILKQRSNFPRDTVMKLSAGEKNSIGISSIPYEPKKLEESYINEILTNLNTQQDYNSILNKLPVNDYRYNNI